MTNHVIFDDTHIFSFTFWDDEFIDLHYFAIDE